MASTALAQPALAAGAGSVFQDLPDDSELEYFEIWSPGVPGRSIGAVGLPCVDPDSDANCGDDYQGFFSLDLNGDGSSVVGGTSFIGIDEHNRLGQAAVWKPQLDGLVLLPDSLIDPESDDGLIQFYGLDEEDLDEITYRTIAMDISSGSERIVGLATGTYQEGELHDRFDWQLPMHWAPVGEDEWDAAEILPMDDLERDSEDVLIGGATSISDKAPEGEELEFIAGFTGVSIAQSEESRRDTSLDQLQATLWRPDGDGWDPLRLGYLDGEFDRHSAANDVNDLGQVVGWSGFAADFESFLEGWGIDGPDGDWSPRPFVWTNENDGMLALSLSDTRHETSYDAGEARAIANSGAVAVGWAAHENEPEDLPFFDESPIAVAWLNTGDNGDWSSNELVNLDRSLDDAVPAAIIDDFAPRDGSVAEAVDYSGTLIVGKALYDYDGDDMSRAVYWQLDDDGEVEYAGDVEADLAAAGVDVSDAEFIDGTDNFSALTNATGVRMVIDEETGLPTSILITGTGEGSFGSWIALLNEKEAGITTPGDIDETLATVDSGARSLAASFGYLADQQYCDRPTGTSVVAQPWCYFATGRGGVFADGPVTGGSLNGMSGAARYFDEANSLGGSAGFDHQQGSSPNGGFSANSAVVGGYASHMPEQGLQARVGVVVANVFDAQFSRTYANGVGTATSQGSTSGFGFGAEGRVAFAQAVDPSTTITPYGELRFGSVHLDGWNETGGPFPATIADIDMQRVAATLGVDAKHKVSDALTLFGGLNLTAVRWSGTGVGATIATLPFAVGATPRAQVLAGAEFGGTYQIDPSTSISAKSTVTSNFGGFFAGSLMGSFNRSF